MHNLLETLRKPENGSEASVEAARPAADRKNLVFLVGPNAEPQGDSNVSNVRQVVRSLIPVW